MYSTKPFDEDTLIDWQREANKEVETKRFCPNCGQFIKLKFREYKYFKNFYDCPICGDTVLVKSMFRTSGGSGYSHQRRRHNANRY